jgi:hypothetical protein
LGAVVSDISGENWGKETRTATTVLDITALGRQEDWEEPKGRADAPAVQSPTSRLEPPSALEVIDTTSRPWVGDDRVRIVCPPNRTRERKRAELAGGKSLASR